jgi:hypothetical protein
MPIIGRFLPRLGPPAPARGPFLVAGGLERVPFMFLSCSHVDNRQRATLDHRHGPPPRPKVVPRDASGADRDEGGARLRRDALARPARARRG